MKNLAVLLLIFSLGSCKEEKPIDDKDKIISELRTQLKDCKNRSNCVDVQQYKDDIGYHITEANFYKNQVDALIDACDRKDKLIKILSEK